MLRQNSELLTNIHRILDMVSVTIAFLLAYCIKKYLLPGSLGGLSTEPNYYLVLLSSILINFIVFNAFSLYESQRTKNIFNTILSNLKAVLLSQFLFIFFLYMLHVPSISRIFFFFNASILFILLSLNKIFLYKSLRYYRTKDFNTRNIAIIGTGKMASELIEVISSQPDTGYRIKGCLSTHEEKTCISDNVNQGVKVIGSIAHYKSFLLENTIDELFFAANQLNEIPDIDNIIRFTEELGISVSIMPDFQIQRIMYQPETARIEFKSFLGLPVISISNIPPNTIGMLIKSCIDYTGAAFGIFLLAPIFLIIALIIKINSEGPVFFKQKRCGLYGRIFTLIKFRTMVVDAEEIKNSLANDNEMDGPVFKIKNDPRITTVGKILRRTSLDELPQLFNILSGHMSLVGPRPPIPEEVEKYEPWQRRRLSMKPGLTCIWQVSGRNEIDFTEWMKMDLNYIDNWSIWLDIKLLCYTVKEIIYGSGR